MLKPCFREARKRTNEEIKILKNEYVIPESMKTYGKNKKYFIKTYGCQMNEHDSENIKGLLEQIGYTETDDLDNATARIARESMIDRIVFSKKRA